MTPSALISEAAMSNSEQKCWAVVSGWYSDFSIHCVFQRREDAIVYAAAQNKIPVEDQERWQKLETLAYTEKRRREMAEIEGRMAAHEDHRAEELDFYSAGVVPVAGR